VEVIDLKYTYLKICMLLVVETIVFNYNIIDLKMVAIEVTNLVVNNSDIIDLL
jgi:hypothetical protein